MKNLSILPVFLLLTQSLSLETDETPRKHNIISNYLDKMLETLFQKLSSGDFSIPEINFGEGVGRVSEMKGRVLGRLEKQVDGIKNFGFKLDTEVTKLLVGGYYDFQNLTVPGLFPVFGKGDFSIYLEAVTLNMSLNAVYISAKEEFEIYVKNLEILIHNSTIKFENLMNDPYLADFLNTLVSDLIPDVAEMLIEPILTMGKPVIDYYGNGIIKCIKDYISSKEKIKNCIQDLFKTKYETNNYEMGTYLVKKTAF